MELPPFHLFTIFFILITSSYLQPITSRKHNYVTDLESLLTFRARVDPHGILAANWTTNTSFCNWVGVRCSPRRERVAAIRLVDLPLQGTISPHLGNLSFLSDLFLSNDSLTGPIPESIRYLPRLTRIVLQLNSLTGPFPSNIFNMSSLLYLYVGFNNLSGSLPSNNSFAMPPRLRKISLTNNRFTGQIPESFGGLISAISINLSYNYLSGSIPKSLASLRYLDRVDLSFNKLEGQVPKGRVFFNSSIPSLIGNKALCGAPQLHIPPCDNLMKNSLSRKLLPLKYILVATMLCVALLTFLCLIYAFYLRRKLKSLPEINVPLLDYHRAISHYELVRATNNFNEATLIGRGGFSSVFRGCLDDGLIVAVKVLNLEVEGSSKSFDAECQVLRMVRHRNLIKIISVCSNLDFKALILEYMSNGSLEQWLYSDHYFLNMMQRLNIMMDVVLGLEHLHHQHPQVVLHCDLKPTNILLDEELGARVSDFGIAKLLLGDSMATASVSGTLGYIAPGNQTIH